jgi:hypothetical protein
MNIDLVEKSILIHRKRRLIIFIENIGKTMTIRKMLLSNT